MHSYVLELKTDNIFFKNLELLLSKINECEENSIVLAPELYLSGFSYDRMKEASEFSKIATKEILKLSKNKIIGISMIEEIDSDNEYLWDKTVASKFKQLRSSASCQTKNSNINSNIKLHFLNVFKLFYNEKVVYKQAKANLFPLGFEHLYFEPGKIENINLFEINGVKIGILICFEIRFIEFWQRLRGADLILVSAVWTKSRKVHFQSLTQALAIANQSYVLASDSANLCGASAIINSFGDVIKSDDVKDSNNNECVLYSKIDLSLVTKAKNVMAIDKIINLRNL